MTKKRDLRQDFDFDECARFNKDLQGETDRGTAIVGAAVLEELLGHLIERSLIDDEAASRELLANPYAPLGTFASRIAAAYCLGLIGDMERGDLKLIKNIRNRFAHGLPGLCFDDKAISERCLKLQVPQMVPKLGLEECSRSPRKYFIDAVSMLATFLDMRRQQTARGEPAREVVMDSPLRSD